MFGGAIFFSPLLRSSETMELMDPEDKKRLELDLMFKLEHVEGDK